MRKSYKRPEPDTAFLVVAKSVPARSEDVCADYCDKEADFICKSFTFLIDDVSKGW